jgi:hypothetical protein
MSYLLVTIVTPRCPGIDIMPATQVSRQLRPGVTLGKPKDDTPAPKLSHRGNTRHTGNCQLRLEGVCRVPSL